MKMLVIAGSLVFWLTGCAVFAPDGFELSANAGLYRVDQRESSSSTRTAAKPMSCWFKNCETSQGQGS